METPSSARRVQRSQALNDLSNNIPISSKGEEESGKGTSKSTKRNNAAAQDRSALIDITNDSPIIGLATGSNTETPSSAFANQRNNICKKTPGSGEALLRGTVKNLLQKVEEEEDAGLPKLSFQGLGSPMGLLAPTQEKDGVDSESEKSVITRTLLFDFSEKSDCSDCSSAVTYQGRSSRSEAEDDDSSVWSIQVNASAREEDAVTEEDYCEYDEEQEEDESLLLDELCLGMSKMSVRMGKHTRFVYNSDDEIAEEEVDNGDATSDVLRLKGLPTPKGKHFRFMVEDDD